MKIITKETHMIVGEEQMPSDHTFYYIFGISLERLYWIMIVASSIIIILKYLSSR